MFVQVVDEIFNAYDIDGSGTLNEKETKRFVIDTLGELGSYDFSEEEFKEAYEEFDKDKNGVIEKNEIAIYVKQLLGH